jgi:nucleoside-diphosphate-sugar epimerase
MALSLCVATIFSAASFSRTATQPLVLAARTRRASVAVSTIAVFGASGGTGSEVVLQAMERGEKVSCLVRDRRNLEAPRSVNGLREGSMVGFSPSTNDMMSVTEGTVLNRADVDEVFEGKNVTGVVVVIGGKTRQVGPTLLQDGTTHIIAACKAYGVKRISVVSTIGAGDSMDQAPWTFKILMNTVMKTVMVDKNAQEALFFEGPGADLDFCIARPGGLKMGSPTGTVNVIDGEAGAINRADLASFCLDAVLEPDFQYLQQAVCISSDKGSGFQSLLSDKSMSRMGGEKRRQKYS